MNGDGLSSWILAAIGLFWLAVFVVGAVKALAEWLNLPFE